MKRKFKGLLKLIAIVASTYGIFRFIEKTKKLKSLYNQCIFFNSRNLKETGVFSGDSVGLICGSLSYDLSEAELNGDIATLDLYGNCSAIRIVVPEGWAIKAEGTNNKSAISNKCESTSESEDKPLLHIKYDMSYSALQITS